jgi:hypothetical protein
MSIKSTEPILWKEDCISYLRSLHGGKLIEDIPLENMLEFALLEDDGEHLRNWGEKITPKKSCKMVFVTTRLMEFANAAEYHTGKTEFVVPDQFIDDLEWDRIHYITFKRNVGNESTYIGKYRLTKIV